MLKKSLYALGWVAIRMYAGLMLRVNIHRQCQLSPGPKLFVANHPSATDPFLIHLIAKDDLNVMITEKAFAVPVFGSFLRGIGEIPVPLKKSSRALAHANRQFRRGRSVAIFIEGHISPLEGGFLPPRTGAARLAISSGVPVVPVGISLQRERCHLIRSRITGESTEAHWYLRGPYAITVGQPVHFEGNTEDRAHVQRVSEVIMHKIRHLAYESEQRLQGSITASSPG